MRFGKVYLQKKIKARQGNERRDDGSGAVFDVKVELGFTKT